jgi:hypothetical protein
VDIRRYSRSNYVTRAALSCWACGVKDSQDRAISSELAYVHYKIGVRDFNQCQKKGNSPGLVSRHDLDERGLEMIYAVAAGQTHIMGEHDLRQQRH